MHVNNTLEVNQSLVQELSACPKAPAQGFVRSGGVFHAPIGSLPPACNTGEGNTKALIDYLSFTIHKEGRDAVMEVMQLLTPTGYSILSWTGLNRGLHGYTLGMIRGNIRLYFEGLPGMGIHVILSGQGVRQLETEFGFAGEAGWLKFLASLRAHGAKFSRFDIALDDYGDDGVLDMGVIEAAAKARNLVTPFHSGKKLNSEEFAFCADAEIQKGETLYFGKRKDSNMFIRIYNKGAEQLIDVHYIRVELEAKRKGAEQLITLLLEKGFEVVASVLLGYLDFKEPSAGDTNKSRWETSPWWSAFVGRVEKCRLGVARPVSRTLEQMRAWLNRQVACPLAVVVDAIEKECEVTGEKPSVARKRFIRGLIESGRERYKPKHLELLGNHSPRLSFGLGL